MNRQSRYVLWGGFALLLLVAVIVGFAVAGTSDEDVAEAVETATAESFGTPLPVFDGTDSGVGAVAPDIEAWTNTGEERVFFDMDDGTVRLVEFFAHWCPHCQNEVPRQTAWLAENRLPDGVEIVTISTGVDSGAPNYPPSAWLRREEWPLPVYVDSADGAIARGYGLGGFPYYVLVDGSGTVIERGAGELTEAQFAALIARAGGVR
jgi:thiol-disulfide isomerase/thioredoxin